MGRKNMASKGGSINRNTGALDFAAAQLARKRGGTAGAGGRYNVGTRRFYLPSTFAGRSVGACTHAGRYLIVGGEGVYSVHPSQHFITLPAGAITASEHITLARVPDAELRGLGKLPKDAVGYYLPKAAKSRGAGRKSRAKSRAKAPAVPAAEGTTTTTADGGAQGTTPSPTE